MTILVRAGVLAALSSLALAGCASRSDDIAAAYVSPASYASWKCDQIRDEASRLSVRAAQVSGAQNQKASNDAVATGVGVVLFWPALLFIKGDSTTAAELSRLKGEMDTIEQVSIQKRCGVTFQRQAAS
jgi:hypothetical protein